ncbi:hypothetical protein [Campylobacter upsaliensis]|uniref:Uncharacterized protein n=1 Tax=Campylobacter upsaliensis TaxID=28080 RepID=A0A381EKU9_CAMUP|nr:hypothetical protein [Campylobacter upsaliensis]MCR2100652.1 hypothetical protein [Campylobacter upsaliensis]SUX27590.1 Uncharacterised protein [Campylobacter upsaliensis]
MFPLSSRRYTGAKTKLLNAIDESILLKRKSLVRLSSMILLAHRKEFLGKC